MTRIWRMDGQVLCLFHQGAQEKQAVKQWSDIAFSGVLRRVYVIKFYAVASIFYANVGNTSLG